MEACAELAEASLYGSGSCAVDQALRGLATLDFDADGDMDLAATNQDCARWILLENDGAGAFTPRAEMATQTRPILPIAADLNDDNVMDVAVPTRIARKIEIYLGRWILADAGEPIPAIGRTPARLSIRPNPFGSVAELAFPVPAGTAGARVEIFDTGGRRVRTLLSPEGSGAMRTVSWNGADDRGHRLPAGIYHVRVHGADGGSRSASAVMLR
jgi:hypothetical protein